MQSDEDNPFEREYPARPVAVWQNGKFKERVMQPPFYPKEPGEQRPGIAYVKHPFAEVQWLYPYQLRDGTWRIDLPESDDD